MPSTIVNLSGGVGQHSPPHSAATTLNPHPDPIRRDSLNNITGHVFSGTNGSSSSISNLSTLQHMTRSTSSLHHLPTDYLYIDRAIPTIRSHPFTGLAYHADVSQGAWQGASFDCCFFASTSLPVLSFASFVSFIHYNLLVSVLTRPFPWECNQSTHRSHSRLD